MAETDEDTNLSESFSSVKYQIIHCNAQRARLRVFRLATDSAYTKRLQQLVESLDFVTGVRINSVAQSLIVEYESLGESSDRFIQEALINCIQTASLRVSENQLTVPYHQTTMEDLASPTVLLLVMKSFIEIPYTSGLKSLD